MPNCVFNNNTPYAVDIVDYDGTRTLSPGESQSNYLIAGPWYVDLVLKLPRSKEVTVKWWSGEFQGRTHNIRDIFKDAIDEFEVKVTKSYSSWRFIYNHAGHFEAEVETEMVTRHSWKLMIEEGVETEAKIGGMIEAIEMSASFKTSTKMTRADEHEKVITEKKKRKFTEPVYLWQEIITVITNLSPPFNELRIPTSHTVATVDNNEPGKKQFLFSSDNE